MGKILKKEFLLAMHPTAIIFLCLSAMLLIPNYPYLVISFYTGLAVFFTCLNGRENNDVYYTLLLPVSKQSIVKARFMYVVIMQLLQMVLAVPFALLRQTFPMGGNQVGMDANIAFFGFSFLFYGIFNYTFFSVYYKDITKVGKAFSVSSIGVFLYMMVVEACAHAIPFFRDYLDTNDDMYVSYKLIVLAVGFVLYLLMTLIVYRKSIRNFERLDV